MTLSPKSNFDAAFQAAQSIPYPEPEKAHSSYIKYFTLRDVPGPRHHVSQILDEITDRLPRTRDSDRKKIRGAARVLLANFVNCIYQRKWLAIPTKPAMYARGDYLHDSLFLTHRPTMAVLDTLKHLRWIEATTPGNNLKHTATLHRPTAELERLIYEWLYLIEKPFDGKYIWASSKETRANEGRLRKSDISKRYMELSPDVEDFWKMRKINEHLREQSYALHGPQLLIYRDEPDMPVRGGRVYMDIQRLPDRRAKIRLSTLINGHPVVEIDLKANHLRMAAALCNEEVPIDPYQEIVNTTGFSRDEVKSVVNRSLGSNHSSRVMWGAKHDSESKIDNEKFRAILDEAERLYPFVPFNTGLGVMLQSLEGQIMINAQLQLIELGMTALPIHDALMIQQGLISESVAEEILKKSWKETLGVTFHPVVERDKIRQ